MDLFASCLPGLEPLLADELAGLGVERIDVLPGGVAFEGDVRTVMHVNLASGLATHVLARAGEFEARGFAELVRKTAAIDWGRWFAPGPVAVRVRSRKSRLYHTGAIEQRVREGLAERLGETLPPGEEDDAEAPRAALVVRIERDRCTLSLDTSGPPLHRRGWRLETAKAPLREDLARALLVASGWDAESPLVDPFCGSGTIVAEAAIRARRLPPGRLRRFAFEATPLFDTTLWHEVRTAAWSDVLERAPGPIRGSDRDEGAVAAARANAERAGVVNDVQFDRAPMSGAPWLSGEPDPLAQGWVVSNPPHGQRVGRADRLRSLYQSLGTRLRALPEAWRVALLVADRRIALATGVPLETAFLTDHGGTKVRAMVRPTGHSPEPMAGGGTRT